MSKEERRALYGYGRIGDNSLIPLMNRIAEPLRWGSGAADTLFWLQTGANVYYCSVVRTHAGV